MKLEISKLGKLFFSNTLLKHEERPWGNFTILNEAVDYKVKQIIVKPSRRLSYQSHTKRNELWFIIRGEAKVTLDGDDIELHSGDTIEIKIGQKHRIHNIGTEDLCFVEIQTGTYFGEDDIIRYYDDYNRF